MINKILSFLNKGEARSIKAKKNILGMFFLKGLSILMSLVIVPITIDYITPYQYGIWLTISSLIAWLSFFDIGLGNGLRNKFIEAITTGKYKLARIYVSTSYSILGSVMLIVWISFSILSYFINWSKILNVPIDMNKELTYVFIILLTNFCFQFVLKLVSTLLIAIQKPAFSSVFDTISQALVAIIILILTKFTQGSLLNLAITLGSVQLIVLLIGSLYVYSHDLKAYSPKFKYVRFSFAKSILNLGIKFFFLQIISIICYQTNNIIITQVLGPNEVTVYGIAYKYMYILTMVFTIILTPFWSAFTEAKTIGDFPWMKKAAKSLRLILIFIALGGILMVILSPIAYKLWIGKSVYIPFLVTVLMYIYHLINTWASLHTQLLAGLGKIKLQLIFSSICGIINIPITLYLCKWLGLPGLILGNIIVFSLFGTWFGYIQVNKILNQKATGIWNE